MSESDSNQNPYAPPEAGLEGAERELEGVDLYRAFVTGTEAQAKRKFVAAKPVDVERYLESFRRRDESGGLRPGWHWPAFFVALPWLVFRRMYLVAVLYFVVLPIVVGAIGGIFVTTSFSPEVAVFVVSIGSIFYVFFLAMYADTLYWWHTNRMIRRAKQTFADPSEQIEWLGKKGGTASFWLVLLALLLTLLINFVP